MSRYLLGYRVEGALKAHSTRDGGPWRFRFKNHDIELRFSDEEKPIYFLVFLEVVGDTYSDANTEGNEIVSEFLDALSFVMQSALFLIGLAVALKDERGKTTRTVFRHTMQDSLPSPLYLREDSAAAVQKILSQAETETNYDLSLRWLRYSYRARTYTELFVNLWLAFERLVGERQIERTCPHCGKKLPSYPAIDKNDAYELMHKYHSYLERAEFEKIWKARQRMFHGGKMDTDFMKTLFEFAPKIRDVVESELLAKYKHDHQLSLPRPNAVTREEGRQGFYEFTVENPTVPFAMNYPTDEQLTEFHKRNDVYGDGFWLVSMTDKVQEKW